MYLNSLRLLSQITTKGVTVTVNMIASGAILTKALPKSLRIYDFYNPGKSQINNI